MSKKVFACLCLLSSAALWHCSDPENDGGNTAGTGGSSGSGAGKAGSSGTGGTSGASGSGGASGAAGMGGTGGTAGAAGASGMGGAAGMGGSPQACDKAKGEFTVASAPSSCFTLLGSASTNVELPSKRTTWSYDEGLTDCTAIGSQLASLATLQEYNEVLAKVDEIDQVAGNPEATPNVWIGARTNGNPALLPRPQYAASFEWVSGEPFTFTNVPANYGDNTTQPPWQPTEPTDTADEFCINMRADFGPRYLMNNWICGNKLDFALCERKLQ